MDYLSLNSIVLALVFLFLFGSFFFIFSKVRSVLTRDLRIEKRLLAAAGPSQTVSEQGSERSAKALHNLASHLTLPGAEEISRLRFQLAQAGFFNIKSVKTFYAARIVSLFGSQFLLLLFWGKLWNTLGTMLSLVFAGMVIGLGLMAPIYFLRWRIKRRTLQCRDGFPDMIDLMVASIEAGLSMDMALVRVGEEIGGRFPVLKVNLDIMNLELRAGRMRHDAMMNFADRINLEEAKALCVMLKQSEDMGSSMGKALRTFSDDMRERRMLLAEEKAMALSAKLTVPLILFIFPTLMVMLLVPAAIRLMESLA